MKEDFIEFETAKLAKEKGFENKHPHKLRRDYYNHLGKLNGDVTKYLKAFCNNEDTSEYLTIDAPTQSELQKWLYEKHQIWVNAQPLFSSNEQIGVHLTITSWKFPPILIEEDNEFDVYKGLEKVLQEALKLIKNK